MSRKERLKRAAAIGSLVGLALVVWFGVADRVKAGARVLHVVNGTRSGATVRFDVPGEAAATGEEVTALGLKPGERQDVLFPEGRYHAQVTLEGGSSSAETVEFVLDGTFVERLADRTAFVLSVGGAATFLWEQEEYGVAPSLHRRPDRVLFGEPFFVSREVDYAFVPFPERIDSSEGTVLRSRLSVFKGEPALALHRFSKDDPRALDYAEQHLSPVAADEELLSAYLRLASARSADARALEFLRRGLSPVSIPWHRAYQDCARAADPDAEAALRVEYARLLAAAPHDARLLYLSGRIAESPERREAHYRDAVAADGECAFAHQALAVLAFRRGRHEEARPHALTASRLRPRDASAADLAFRVRFALGDYAALAKETDAHRGLNPVDLLLLRRALELAAAQSDSGRGRELLQEYRQEVRARLPQDPQQLVLLSELMWQELEHDAAAAEKLAVGLRSPDFRARVLFQTRMEAGNFEAAAAGLGEAEAQAPWTCEASLWLCVVLSGQGGAEAESRWRERAIASLAQGSPDEARAGELLREGARDLDPILGLSLSPSLKAALLLALGGGDASFVEAARRFDVTFYFPHRVLNR